MLSLWSDMALSYAVFDTADFHIIIVPEPINLAYGTVYLLTH